MQLEVHSEELPEEILAVFVDEIKRHISTMRGDDFSDSIRLEEHFTGHEFGQIVRYDAAVTVGGKIEKGVERLWDSTFRPYLDELTGEMTTPKIATDSPLLLICKSGKAVRIRVTPGSLYSVVGISYIR